MSKERDILSHLSWYFGIDSTMSKCAEPSCEYTLSHEHVFHVKTIWENGEIVGPYYWKTNQQANRTMRVRFRSYCYGCRLGKRWSRRTMRCCMWQKHRWDWEYYIHCDGQRLIQRQGFKTFDRAWDSATRAWYKLSECECITTQ